MLQNPECCKDCALQSLSQDDPTIPFETYGVVEQIWALQGEDTFPDHSQNAENRPSAALVLAARACALAIVSGRCGLYNSLETLTKRQNRHD